MAQQIFAFHHLIKLYAFQSEIFHEPSGCLQAVPVATSSRPSMYIVDSYSRQLCPDVAVYVRVGLNVPECLLSGFFHDDAAPACEYSNVL